MHQAAMPVHVHCPSSANENAGLYCYLKIRLLTSTVEAVLLYGCETWSLSKKQERKLDGSYTRELRKALNISWREHVTNERRPDFPTLCYGYQIRDKGSRGRGRPTGTFIDTLMRDTGLQLEEMHACMQDKGESRTNKSINQ